ncbi:MAG TPA: Clp protease N-terminal domain-containing protein [Candidatus Dormibacteraeota bacterium]
MPETLTSDAREIIDRATANASHRGSSEVTATDVLRATLQLPGSLADNEIRALGVDPKTVASQVPADGDPRSSPPLNQLLVNAGREAQVLGHYQVDSIHLLLALLYSDSPATAAVLQKAGLSLYDLRSHLQTGSKAAQRDYSKPPPDRALRRRPWPSLRGVVNVSPFFLAAVGVTAASGVLLWTNVVPRYAPLWTSAFIIGGWIVSLCIHEFGHAVVAYLGGDRSVVGAGYLTLNPLRYHNLLMSLILPVVFLLFGGIALPGGAVYINHSALRTRAWSSAVSLAGPFGTLLCGLLIAAVFLVAGTSSITTVGSLNFFGALAGLGFFMALAVVLNLLPVPGLDGFGIIRPWLPYSMQDAAMRFAVFGVYGIFILLWFVAPVRSAFFGLVFQLTALAHIDPQLVTLGISNMRLI